MSQAHILVVDDEPDIRELVREILEDEGYEVRTAADGESARQAYSEHTPDLVLLDIWMPDVDGISLLREWSEERSDGGPVVMISGHATLETAVEATRLGAHDFIQKPLSLAKLLATVKGALKAGQEPRRPGGRGASTHDATPVGSSAAMQLLRQKAEQAAPHDTPVLITGEPGTGRETLARYVHRLSGRDGAFVVLDACAMAGDGMRAHLLGEQEGDDGVLAQADGGTLFVPDVQSRPEPAQALLEQVLEQQRYTPENGRSPRAVACRVIASCRPGLEAEVQDGEFLAPLFYRLNVLPLDIPPLRERPDDIPELVRHFADWFPDRENLPYRAFSVSAQNRLRNHPWPGNVRELRNVIQRLLVMGGDGEVSAAEVDRVLKQAPTGVTAPEGTHRVSFDQPLREAREQFEREYLLYQLERAGGSVGKLSEAVGMERTHLYRKLRALGIDPKTGALREDSA